jgi:hypothetical protein
MFRNQNTGATTVSVTTPSLLLLKRHSITYDRSPISLAGLSAVNQADPNESPSAKVEMTSGQFPAATLTRVLRIRLGGIPSCSNPAGPAWVGLTKQGFIRTATLIGMRTRAGSVRINPVGLNRVAAPLQRYGDCKTARA